VPPRYEFRVAGHLSLAARQAVQSMSEGMTVEVAAPETVMSGPVTDESHLYGVIRLLESLGLTVTAINRIPD
jgi:hypothetical protein